MTDRTYEAPSGKGAADENFPVGSFLISAPLRPHVAKFYAFARAIDDIADNPSLNSDDKISRLDAFARALQGDLSDELGLEKAHRLRASLHETGVTIQHGLDLIAAFKRDSIRSRCDDWADLMDYCNLSAAPVGRYLLDLHGESPDGYRTSDALCNALQVINHLQDCADDRRNLDRIYLPQNWMAEAGIDDTHLDHSRASQGLRRVLDRCLQGVEQLIDEAEKLPIILESRTLALESGAIVALARRLTDRLWREDPLSHRIALNKLGFLAVGCNGITATLWGRWRRRRRQRTR